MSTEPKQAATKLPPPKLIQFRWTNFRSFEDTGPVNLEPITIFLGANNSGKSSLLLPLLLLKQTLESKDDRVPLLLRGPIVDVGAYEDVVHLHDSSRDIGFSLTFDPDSMLNRQRIQHLPIANTVSWEFRKNPDPLGPPLLHRFKADDESGRTVLDRIREEDGSYSFSLSTTKETYHHIQQLQDADKDRPDKFLFDPLPYFAELVMQHAPTGSEGTPVAEAEVEAKLAEVIRPELIHYLAVAFPINLAIQQFLRRLSYLGPLREPPRRRYDIRPEAADVVGIKGENAPHLILRHQKLAIETSRWLSAFGLAVEVRATKKDSQSFDVEIQRTPNSPWVNVADSGFGISQILPLIVQASSPRQGSSLLVEQPELHLNPRQQATVATLLADLASKDHFVFVETHSEHLLLRLRRLVAEASLGASQVGLRFVEKKADTSDVRPVNMSALGHIAAEDWPHGFFEDSLREAMALAHAQMKHQERER